MFLLRLNRLFVLGICFFSFSEQSFALMNLKKVQVIDSSQVDLIFDEKVDSNQIKTDFQNDIIQISLNNSSVYPAKVHHLSGSDMLKIFAYQYSPKLVRARFSVKGLASDYQNRVQLKASGKVLSLILSPADKAVAQKSSVKAEVNVAPAVEKKAELPETITGNTGRQKAELSAKEKQILERVESAKAVEPAQATSKSIPSPMRAVWVTIGVVGLFLGFVFGLKKIQSSQAMSRLLGKSGISKSTPMKIIATHSLGPKKSLMMVKVQDRTLVLGVSEEQMTLITEITDQEEAEDSSSGPEVNVQEFAQKLRAFETKAPVPTQSPKVSQALAQAAHQYAAGASSALKATTAPATRSAGVGGQIRSQIRSKTEGLKPL